MATHLIPKAWARAGVYRITHVASGRHYVGSSQDVTRRLRTHVKHLTDGRHYNEHLQAAWNKYGPDAFALAPMEWVEDHAALTRVEQEWMDAADAYEKGYNQRPRADSCLGSRRAVLYDWFPTSEQADAWVARMYAAGIPVNVIAGWYGTSTASVHNAAARGGASILRPGAAQTLMRFRQMGLDEWFDSPGDAARHFRAMHDAGVSVSRIAEAFGTQYAVVARYIARAGGATRRLGDARRTREGDRFGRFGGLAAAEKWARQMYEAGCPIVKIAPVLRVRKAEVSRMVRAAGGEIRGRSESMRMVRQNRRAA